MPIPAMQVTYGLGDFEPPTPTAYDEFHGTARVIPSWIYRRAIEGGPVEPVQLADAGQQIRGTQFYPWYWLGLLAAGQVIPACGHYYAADRRTVEAA